jgi:transcriptional regulator with XRE-family HTH domain
MSVDITANVTTLLSARVAANIRALMAYKQIRQSQLARRIDKGEQWLSVRLRGVQEIGLNDLDLIAGALEIDPADLLRPAGAGFTLRYKDDEDAAFVPAAPLTGHRPAGAHPGTASRPQNRPTGRASGPGRTYRTRPPVAA